MKPKVVHGWSTESKSMTACGLRWIYGRHSQEKEPLKMCDSFTKNGVTCKRCLKSGHLRTEEL